jgi:protein-L-isoaspartate O-methyltransferase
MSTVKEHYENILSEVYVWMFDGFDNALKKSTHFFKMHKISPTRSGVAIDLGAGCGFQSIPLAKAGFNVTAIDLDSKLLSDLKTHSSHLPIKIIQDDLINFDQHTKDNAELIVCMTDTICHLESKDKVKSLFKKVIASLEEGGRFIVTFRDLSFELPELDRFIPVKSDDNTVFTCFLEYEPETVKVHDLVYRKIGGNWSLNKSYYRKLRLSKEWTEEQLTTIGFTQFESTVDKGFVTVISVK